MIKAAGTPPPQRRIRSIEVGFRILRVLVAADGALRLKDIAAGAGMPTNKVHPYLVSFVHTGVVEQDPHTMEYLLGRQALQIGIAAFRQTDLTELARQELPRLREITQCAAYVSLWSNKGPSIVQKVDGPFQGSMSIRLGFVLPLLLSATGRVFLSHLPNFEFEELLAQEKKRPDVRGLSKLTSLSFVETVRSQGYALSTENIINPGFFGMAGPVFDHSGSLAATLTILGPRHLLDKEGETHFGRIITESAQKISHAGDASRDS